MFLRNQFEEEGKYGIPKIPKFDFKNEDLENLRLIGFDVAKSGKGEHFNRMVHFFLYDYKFECIWEKPDKYIDVLKKYKAVLTPDFSMYTEMAKPLKIYNTFRNRWCGAYLASKGIPVIPTVCWGKEDTFDFCFEGIEKGSTVVVSTYMVSEHDNHSDQKEFFMTGYNEMLKRIEPENIICYHEPFPEMEGNVIYVNYELSSWRYFNTDEVYEPSKYFDYISGAVSKSENCGIIVKSYGYVLADSQKGMGSAYGGDWQPSPNKPEDARFLGEPGEIKYTHFEGKNGGYERATKIGDDGRAIKERHFTDHNQPSKHTNPHDHFISWDNKRGFPDPSEPMNYPKEVPEFKSFKEIEKMNTEDMNNDKKITYTVIHVDPENYRFKTISDFKDCMSRGGEVEFEWNNKTYCAFGKLQKTVNSAIQMCISEAYKPETEKWCDNADEVLEYVIDGQRLREIITKVTVWDRTI